MSEPQEVQWPAREPRIRDAALTRMRILKAAISEFAEHGLSGARMDAIARRAGANMRMLYHYYGSKEDLYLTVLEHVYEDIRTREQQLNLEHLDPQEAMLALFEFTFSHFAQNPEIVSLWSGENMQRARFLSRSRRATEISSPLLTAIESTLRRGQKAGIFRPKISALQLYVSMVALSYFHISNAYTLSTIFRTDLHSKKWQDERRAHAREMIMAYLRPTE
ncbi:MAG TPA: TetR/AcrR family transcriptional regulator [Steroidobacteraceae bacterium]